MGCSISKLDDEDAVQLCKDRKKFIKQAVEHRMHFASGHIAYIKSLKRVSAALREYIEGDEHREFLLDSYTAPTFTPIKKTNPGFISISPTSFSLPIQSVPSSSLKVNYLRSSGTPAVSIEERPQSPVTIRTENYSPVHMYGTDGFFPMHSSPTNPSFFHYSPNNRPNFPPPSPETSQWDFFWNPFSALDYYGYPSRNSLDHAILDDDAAGLRQVREEEGIPELEEETEQEEFDNGTNHNEQKAKVDVHCARDEVVVEDVDDDEDNESTTSDTETEHEVRGLQSQGSQSIDVSEVQNVGQVCNQETDVRSKGANRGTPGFTVYVNRRITSMAEVLEELEKQFITVCNSANEVSAMLEAHRAQYTTSNELSARKMLNPVTLIRTASSRSSSSRLLVNSSTLKDEGGSESSSEFSEESSSMLLNSHQSTLDRLYAWEKKLYEEVRAGERVRIAYEKKYMQLQKQDIKGADPSSVDKTRVTVRDLSTQMKVSIHTVEAISKRIETLRDEELQPQLLELIQGLARMWKVMAECHRLQKHSLDQAKHLLAGIPSKLSKTKTYTIMSPSEPYRLASSAANLETELRNWRACFQSWITSQRSYAQSLSGWLLRCIQSDPDTSKVPFSPRRSVGAPAIFNSCIQWSRFLNNIHEIPVLDGLDFFVAGIGSLYAKQLREDSRKNLGGSKRFGGKLPLESGENMEVIEFKKLEEEEVMTAEKMAEVAIRVLCAGMSVAVTSLTEFAIGSAEGYAELVKQWEKTKPSPPQSSNGNSV